MNLTKLPRPEIEPVSSGSRFSVTPHPVNGGTVASPSSAPPVGTVYPFGGIVLKPRPIRTSVIGDAGRQSGPTFSGTPFASTLLPRPHIFLLVFRFTTQ